MFSFNYQNARIGLFVWHLYFNLLNFLPSRLPNPSHTTWETPTLEWHRHAPRLARARLQNNSFQIIRSWSSSFETKIFLPFPISPTLTRHRVRGNGLLSRIFSNLPGQGRDLGNFPEAGAEKLETLTAPHKHFATRYSIPTACSTACCPAPS